MRLVSILLSAILPAWGVWAWLCGRVGKRESDRDAQRLQAALDRIEGRPEPGFMPAPAALPDEYLDADDDLETAVLYVPEEWVR